MAIENIIADANQATDIDHPNIKFSDQNDYETMPNYEVLGEESPLARLDLISHGKISLSVSQMPQKIPVPQLMLNYCI